MLKTSFALLLCGAVGAAYARAGQQPQATAADIMKRVGENQDHGQEERSNFIYEEKIHVATRRSNGKLAREEWTTSLVIPSAKGVEKKRQAIWGRYWRKGRYLEFKGEPVPDTESLDGGLTTNFRDELLNKNSKDGIEKDLFPLTSKEQAKYKFELGGEEMLDGRPVYRVRFRPADAHDITWAGEAVIDKEELQPVMVYSRLSRRLPFFVRTMLGTDVPGLGFSTRYARVAKNTWFPVSFGTEFRLHAVFFLNRTVILSMEARNFKRASADSNIHYDDKPPQ